MNGQRLFSRITMVFVIAAASVLLQPAALAGSSTDEQAVEDAYKAYIAAWKIKDIAALQNLISDDYMAVNFENKVSTKENEIATAKSDATWNAMDVDEIHARIFGDFAIASGFISAQGRKADGSSFRAKVRFLAALAKRNSKWQLVATQSTGIKSPASNQR